MSWYCYRKYFEKRHNEILPGILKSGLITNKKAYELASGQIYDEMLQYLSGVSRVNLRKRTQLTKPIYILFSEIGEDKIMRIKSYSANKLSKLTDMQIDTIKNHLTTQREKNSRTHVTSEMITTIAPGRMTSEKIVNAFQTIPAEDVSVKHLNGNSSDDSSRIDPVAVSTSSTTSSSQISKSNRSGLLVSILPDDPEEKRKHIIELVLERFPSLSLSDSSERGERFDLNSSTLCPLCKGDHKEESLWNDIRGTWVLVNIVENELIVSNAKILLIMKLQ
jgi:hypothetical protein